MSTPDIQPAVEIRFECTPLRTVSRLDIPLDASPGYRKRLERFQQAIAKHGHRNTYYLTEGSCVFRFTNNTDSGWVRFMIEGTVITDDTDSKTGGSDLTVQLGTETCDWLTQPAVEWLTISAKHAMEAEFDRYITAGDLSQAMERLAREQSASDEAGGFLGMNL